MTPDEVKYKVMMHHIAALEEIVCGQAELVDTLMDLCDSWKKEVMQLEVSEEVDIQVGKELDEKEKPK